jgi:hypothetical protein
MMRPGSASLYVCHSDVRTTKNVYVHRFESEREADVARMDEFLERAAPAGRAAQ